MVVFIGEPIKAIFYCQPGTRRIHRLPAPRYAVIHRWWLTVSTIEKAAIRWPPCLISTIALSKMSS
jgi:hypothetical protein